MAAPRKENVNELILHAAESLLKTKALSDISLAEIARTAGISKGTLYYHYKNKEDILFAIMDSYLKEQWKNLLEWTADASKDTSLPRLLKYILERDISTADMRFHFFYDAASGNEEIREKIIQRYSDFASLIADKIGERTSKIAPEYLAWFILLLSDGLFMHKMLKNPNIDIEKFIAQTEQYAKAGLL